MLDWPSVLKDSDLLFIHCCKETRSWSTCFKKEWLYSVWNFEIKQFYWYHGSLLKLYNQNHISEAVYLLYLLEGVVIAYQLGTGKLLVIAFNLPLEAAIYIPYLSKPQLGENLFERVLSIFIQHAFSQFENYTVWKNLFCIVYWLVLEKAAAPKKFDLYSQISNINNLGCKTEKKSIGATNNIFVQNSSH